MNTGVSKTSKNMQAERVKKERQKVRLTLYKIWELDHNQIPAEININYLINIWLPQCVEHAIVDLGFLN